MWLLSSFHEDLAFHLTVTVVALLGGRQRFGNAVITSGCRAPKGFSLGARSRWVPDRSLGAAGWLVSCQD